jgi:hypothetical protein
MNILWIKTIISRCKFSHYFLDFQVAKETKIQKIHVIRMLSVIKIKNDDI